MKQNQFGKIFISIFIFGSFFSCSKTIYNNAWQSQKVDADGNPKEWEIPLRYFDEKSKLQYTLTNDSVNLYVCIRATDEQMQQKIIRVGMQIWIDTTGKKKRQTGIFFPIANTEFKKPSSSSGYRRGGNHSDSTRTRQYQQPDSRMLKARYDKEPKEMQLIGFNSPIGGISPLQNEYGFSFNIDWDNNGIMTYEAIIPFKTFCRKSFSLAANKKNLGITILIPALPAPPMSGGGGRGGGMGGGGGMHGGGMGGGGMRGGGGGMHGGGGGRSQESDGSSALYETNKIIMRIKLAAQPK